MVGKLVSIWALVLISLLIVELLVIIRQEPFLVGRLSG